MGLVYEAMDLKLDRRVALKCALPGYHYRLGPEVRAAREVSHFNICKVHELHTLTTPDGEIDCLSMEFIDGETLWQRLAGKGPLRGEEAREVARQICAGLAQAHRQGVIHGDLKSANVILGKSREGRIRAVITDFGLGRLATDPAGRAGGTRDYMSPEIYLGEPNSVASDIYSLGVLFHVICTGHTPARKKPLPERPDAWSPDSQGSTRTALESFPEEDWVREIEPLPAPWKRVVAHCMEPLPGKRPATVEAVLREMEPRRWALKAVAAGACAAVLAAGARQWSSQVSPMPVRLAILPFTLEGDRSDATSGMGLEVAERLTGARREFAVFSPREAERNQATTPDKARRSLGATHVLQVRVRSGAGTMTTNASLIDTRSGGTIRQLQGTYAAADAPILAKALVATVTEAFRLPSSAPRESVAPSAYPYYVQGIDLLRADDAANADRAAAFLAKAIELDPRSALPYAGLAEAQIQKADRGDGSKWLDEAQATVAKAVSINPDSIPVLLVAGIVQQRSGQYERAIQLLTRATEREPGNSEAWRRLAFCYENANRPDEAAATYQRAIRAQPDYYRHYLSLGTFYFNRSQFARAEEQYRRVVSIAPGLGSGHMNLGLALMQQARLPEAETELLEALRLRRSPNLELNIGALYYYEGRFEQAERYFQESISAGGASAMHYRNLGDAQRHLGRAKDAAASYRRGRELAQAEIMRNPRRAASHSLLGLLNALLGDRTGSNFEISQALSIDPENRSVIRDAVFSYELMGLRDEAFAVMRHAPRYLLEEFSRQPDVTNLCKDPRFQNLLLNAPVQ
jgi:tetratricopeptide (TPR) repeat protein/TolB-like protein